MRKIFPMIVCFIMVCGCTPQAGSMAGGSDSSGLGFVASDSPETEHQVGTALLQKNVLYSYEGPIGDDIHFIDEDTVYYEKVVLGEIDSCAVHYTEGYMISTRGEFIKATNNAPVISPDSTKQVVLFSGSPAIKGPSLFGGAARNDWIVRISDADTGETIASWRYDYYFTDDIDICNPPVTDYGDARNGPNELPNFIRSYYWADDDTIIINGLAIWSIRVSTGEIERISHDFRDTIKDIGYAQTIEDVGAELVGRYDNGIVYMYGFGMKNNKLYYKPYNNDIVLISESYREYEDTAVLFDNTFIYKQSGVQWYILNLMTGKKEAVDISGAVLHEDFLFLFYPNNKLAVYSHDFRQIKEYQLPQVIRYDAAFFEFISSELFIAYNYIYDLKTNKLYLLSDDDCKAYLDDSTPIAWPIAGGKKVVKVFFSEEFMEPNKGFEIIEYIFTLQEQE